MCEIVHPNYSNIQVFHSYKQDAIDENGPIDIKATQKDGHTEAKKDFNLRTWSQMVLSGCCRVFERDYFKAGSFINLVKSSRWISSAKYLENQLPQTKYEYYNNYTQFLNIIQEYVHSNSYQQIPFFTLTPSLSELTPFAYFEPYESGKQMNVTDFDPECCKKTLYDQDIQFPTCLIPNITKYQCPRKNVNTQNKKEENQDEKEERKSDNDHMPEIKINNKYNYTSNKHHDHNYIHKRNSINKNPSIKVVRNPSSTSTTSNLYDNLGNDDT